MPEIGHSSSSLGANAGSRGRLLVRWYSLTWPYVRMPFAVTCRRVRVSPPKGLMLMKTARFLAGWGVRSFVRSCGRPIAASQRVSDAFRGMPDPAIPPRRYAARRFSPLVVVVVKT